MPLVGFLDNQGDKVSFDDALSGKTDLHFLRQVLHKIWKICVTNYHRDSVISGTMLLTCLRKVFLERKIKYWQHPSKLWYAVRGQLCHSLLDPGQDEIDYFITEKKFFRKVAEPEEDCPLCKGNGWEMIGIENTHQSFRPCYCTYLSGTCDGYDITKKTLVDLKTTGESGLFYRREGADPKHEFQCSIYAWIMSNGIIGDLSEKDIAQLREHGSSLNPIEQYPGWYTCSIPVEKATINYLTLMNATVQTGGFLVDKTQYLLNPPPKHPNEISRKVLKTMDVTYKNGSSGAKVQYEITYQLPEATLADFGIVEGFVAENRYILRNAFVTGEIPGMCEQSMRDWLCGYCPTQSTCSKINTDGLVNINELG